MFDVNKLTMGEIARVEELSGQSIAMFGEDETPKGKFLAALVYVFKRRSEPKYTWNEACGLTLPEASEILGLGDKPETTEGETDDAAGVEDVDPTLPTEPKRSRKSKQSD